MTDRYAVFGNPIGHSKSPAIHTAFARATGANLRYDACLAPRDGFAATIRGFIAEGGRGANVTVPFKEEAYRLADTLSARAQRAGAVNTLRFDGAAIYGDNTDGAGLVRDLECNLGFPLAQRRILLLGAGGAARGVVGPLLDCQPAMLHIANRTAEKAILLASQFADCGPVRGGGYADLDVLADPFDIVINATSASLGGEVPAVPSALYTHAILAYDMMYGAQDTAFLAAARSHGLAGLRLADGLGMLVEQAAEAFLVWRGIRPVTGPVLADLRAQLQS